MCLDGTLESMVGAALLNFDGNYIVESFSIG